MLRLEMSKVYKRLFFFTHNITPLIATAAIVTWTVLIQMQLGLVFLWVGLVLAIILLVLIIRMRSPIGVDVSAHSVDIMYYSFPHRHLRVTRLPNEIVRVTFGIQTGKGRRGWVKIVLHDDRKETLMIVPPLSLHEPSLQSAAEEIARRLHVPCTQGR